MKIDEKTKKGLNYSIKDFMGSFIRRRFHI